MPTKASATKKPAAKKAGLILKNPATRKSASPALSLAALKAALQLIWAALWPSCPARKSISALCAMSRL
jgi:hypothetical protein